MSTGGLRKIRDNVGEDVLYWCQTNNLKRYELAEILEVSESTVYEVWSGKRVPSFHMILILSELMDKPLDFFLEPSSSEENNKLNEWKRKIAKRNGGSIHQYPPVTEDHAELNMKMDAVGDTIKAIKNLQLKKSFVRQYEDMAQTAALIQMNTTDGNQ